MGGVIQPVIVAVNDLTPNPYKQWRGAWQTSAAVGVELRRGITSRAILLATTQTLNLLPHSSVFQVGMRFSLPGPDALALLVV